MKSKKEGKNQESIQSSATPDPGYRKSKTLTVQRSIPRMSNENDITLCHLQVITQKQSVQCVFFQIEDLT